MSRQGNCWDTAPVESWCGTLKTEVVPHRRYQRRAAAAREMAEDSDAVRQPAAAAGAARRPVTGG